MGKGCSETLWEVTAGTEKVSYMIMMMMMMMMMVSAGSRRSQWVQLCGAMAMLVLLGVPWVFSAFGAIDARENSQLELVEGVFQVHRGSQDTWNTIKPKGMHPGKSHCCEMFRQNLP